MTITQEALKELIARGESEALEFKGALSDMNRVVEVVASLANTSGGVVLIGVGSQGRILGLTIGDQTIERLANTITDNTDPAIYPEISTYSLDGRKMISIKVTESPDRPHLAFGRPFRRVGNVTKGMRRDEYERLLLQREKGRPQFGSQLCEGVSMEALDETYVMRYLQQRAESRGIEIPRIPLEQILVNIGVAVWKKGRFIPTNAGVLFFGTEPQQFLPHSELKIARFKGTTTTEFIDRAELRATLPELIDEAEKFVRRNTRRATKIVEFEQVNIAEYPYEAVREAITNGVAHRDYFFTGASIRVMIFDDRIEVESPGRLPEGVSLKNLEGSHVLRNERIANLLYDIGYIEKWGTGIRRMRDSMRIHGLKEPEFEERGRFFKVTFYGPGDEILDLVKSRDRVDLRTLGLNDRHIEALRCIINERRTFTIEEYANCFKVHEKTARRDFKKLIEIGLVEKIGRTKGAYFKAK